MDLVIVAIAVVIVLALIYWFGVKDYALLSDIPINGPKPWPYIGNLPDFIQDGGMHKTLWKYFKRFGRVHKFYVGRRPGFVVTDPEMIKIILVKEFDKFRNRPRFIKFNPPLSYVLFVTQDGAWKRIRTILTPTFTAAKLRQINPIVEDCLETLQKKMQDYSATGEDVNITRLFALFALDVIMKVAFGYDTDVQNQPNDEFLSMARNSTRVALWRRAFTAFPFSDQLCDIFNIRVFANSDYFLDIARKVIASRQEQAGSHIRHDVLQLMLEAHDKQVDGKPKLSDDEVAAQCFVFLLAGFETTSTTLASTAYFMANHPDIQETFQQELDKTREGSKDDLYDLVHHIEYLDKVVCEVLRLCTPGFNLLRTCNEDVVIKGVRFPKGVDVNIPIYCLHRDPEAWKRPDDFYPEHFSAEAKEKRHPYSYMPFGLGPRQCIGMRLALHEVKTALFTIMKTFKFARCRQTVQLEHKATVIMLPKNDVFLKICKR